MKILMMHNLYRQPGGEDKVVEAETELLRAHGHEVVEFGATNATSSRWQELQMIAASPWSRSSYRAVRELCAREHPDIAHVHNFWMGLTPSVHAACQDSGVPTVQTLHNFRLTCANALLDRDGDVCEDCVGKLPWRGVTRRCYRDSALASAAVATMIAVNRARRTWEKVDAFISLSRHAVDRYTASGVPAGRIFVKPNFVEDPGPAGRPSASRNIVFAGRLSQEKGVRTLLGAWKKANPGGGARLQIAGDGPQMGELRFLAAELGLDSNSTQFLGWQSAADLAKLIAGARAVVIPSNCFENFPRVAVEALAWGRPPIASNRGALAEIIRPEAGMHPTAGDAASFAEAIRLVLANDALADRLGAQARRQYIECYTPEINYSQLMAIYRQAMAGAPSPVLQAAGASKER